MPIKGFLGKIKTPSEVDYIEIEDSEIEKEDHRIKIKIRTLEDFESTEIIRDDLRNGNIVWVKIKPLKEKDISELKRAVNRLRKTAIASEGDIAGVDEDYLVIAPKGVMIHRG